MATDILFTQSSYNDAAIGLRFFWTIREKQLSLFNIRLLYILMYQVYGTFYNDVSSEMFLFSYLHSLPSPLPLGKGGASWCIKVYNRIT